MMDKISVNHELLKKNNRIRVRKFSSDGYEQFKIRLSISGPLHQISYVEYELHPTFKNKIRISEDNTAGFPIEFWTWGEFEIQVTAHFKDGHDELVMYQLQYGAELPSSEDSYNDETPLKLKEEG